MNLVEPLMVMSSVFCSFQIAEVVSDVFGSSKYSPLVPQTPPTDSPTLKKTPSKNTNVQKGMYSCKPMNLQCVKLLVGIMWQTQVGVGFFE